MSELIRTLEKERETYIASGSSEDKAVAFGLSIAIREIEKQPQLNDNQKIVLDWLQLQTNSDSTPMQTIFWMMNKAAWGRLDELREPIMGLNREQQAQVLEVFAKWAQEMECE
ncbi:hypothetical protein BAU15_05280 [Enterococcus sp. JM4C]|uniref:hypothetical protein n=1 Tax=Candidatus Enterococcus huntleyi TaxID=1857217 RepID=UPI00137B6E91|nr:hypothetical protein [Enterococcus sp. JM4C]KAF1295165.1 hypothetical protein BAU15_05280 [Enterococcus sp. JM4C]